MFLEICMQIHSMAFALSRHINKQKYAKTINLLCAGKKNFVKYQTQGGLSSPPPCVRPWSPREVTFAQFLSHFVKTIFNSRLNSFSTFSCTCAIVINARVLCLR